ncbi:MAG: hypothetical protein ACRC7N_01885 [Clostridium sp.]
MIKFFVDGGVQDKQMYIGIISNAYNGIYCDNIADIKSLQNNTSVTNVPLVDSKNNDLNFIIENLKKDIEKKDIIIKDLIKIISKLNCNTSI